MIKSIRYAFALLLCAGTLTAQITVTNATFPQTGDTLRTATDLAPSGIVITAAGGPFTWDFSGLDVGVQNETVFRNASEGNAFDQVSNATHVVIGDQAGAETYFRVTNDKVELLAANGNDPTGIGISSLFRFTPPILQRRAPMSFPASNTSQANLLIGFSWSELPPILTDSLPLPITPDSIRLRIAIDRTDFVDAYGQLTIPGGTYDVLREKRTAISETKVEVKIGFLGWQDVTTLLAANFEGLGTDTTVTYDFFSNTEKEVIASVSVEADGTPTSVTFKDNGILSADYETPASRPSVSVVPNPVPEVAHFQFDHFPQGEYSLSIFSQNGALVLEKSLPLNGTGTASIDLPGLPAAAYFFFLKNDGGEIFARGKLVKQ